MMNCYFLLNVYSQFITTSSYFFIRCLDVDIPKFKSTLHQCTSHYNRAYEMFYKMDRPLECLEILIKNIALDELQIDSM